MQKKKILILMKTMNIGGAERSLLGLLDSFDYDNYDIYFHLNAHTGEFLKYTPKKVQLIKESDFYKSLENPLKKVLFSKNFLIGFARLLGKIEFHLIEEFLNKNKISPWNQQQYFNKYTSLFLPKISNNFDLAINFLGVPNNLVNKVNSKVKLTWIHTDYNQIEYNRTLDLKYYDKVDRIVNVSEDCNNVFLEHYPELKSKSIVIENILSDCLIHNQAKEFSVDPEIIKDSNCINILSIGRFGKAKNFDNIPKIVFELINKGLQVKWYLIGYGNDEIKIKSNIKKYDVSNNVIILGKKTNPYPYIKACDVYIQPSRFEGKSVTVREAQILNKPVIITNYQTANSQLTNGYDGIIIPLETNELIEELYKVLLDKKLLEKVSQNTKDEDYTNSSEINKIYKIMENNNGKS